MIDPKELRIGNLVSHEDHGVIDIFSITNDEINFKYYIGGNEINPIPITEEWLIKFGFNKRDELDGYIEGEHDFNLDLRKNKHGQIAINSKTFATYIYSSYDCTFYGFETKIEYVHQIQNLIFALTGEELEIK